MSLESKNQFSSETPEKPTITKEKLIKQEKIKQQKLLEIKYQETVSRLSFLKKLLIKSKIKDEEIIKEYKQLKQKLKELEQKIPVNYKDILNQLAKDVKNLQEKIENFKQRLKIWYILSTYIDYLESYISNPANELSKKEKQRILQLTDKLAIYLKNLKNLNQDNINKIEKVFAPDWEWFQKTQLLVIDKLRKNYNKYKEKEFNQQTAIEFLKDLRKIDSSDNPAPRISYYDNSKNILYRLSYMIQENPIVRYNPFLKKLIKIEENLTNPVIFKSKEFRENLYKRWNLPEELQTKIETQIEEFVKLVEENWKQNKDKIKKKVVQSILSNLDISQSLKNKLAEILRKQDDQIFKQTYEIFMYSQIDKILRTNLFSYIVKTSNIQSPAIDFYKEIIWEKHKLDVSDSTINSIKYLTGIFIEQFPIILATSVLSEWFSVLIWWEEILSSYKALRLAKLLKERTYKRAYKRALTTGINLTKQIGKNIVTTGWMFYVSYEWSQTVLTGKNQFTLENLWKDVFVIWGLKIYGTVKAFIKWATWLDITKLRLPLLTEKQNKVLQTTIDYLNDILVLWWIESWVKLTFDGKINWTIEEVIHMISMVIALKYTGEKIFITREKDRIITYVWEWEVKNKRIVNMWKDEIVVYEKKWTNKWKESWEETFWWRNQAKLNRPTLRNLVYMDENKLRPEFEKLIKEGVNIKDEEILKEKIWETVDKSIEDIVKTIEIKQAHISDIWLYMKYEEMKLEWKEKSSEYKENLYEAIIAQKLKKVLPAEVRKYPEVVRYIERLVEVSEKIYKNIDSLNNIEGDTFIH